MRTLVDLKEEQVRELDRLARARRQSRASIIRLAVSSYLAGNQTREASDAFGLWSHRKVDGLEYQEEVRREW